MMKIKVGMMPGRLVEVVVEEGTTAREIFKVAEVELSNHEIRLDGEKIDLDKTINNGSLLVAMKMIKGNMPTIKVGMMPGRLEVVNYTEGETAQQIFNKTNIELSNHEIRLDGEKIGLDTTINNGGLLVAMKMIKGNSDVYVTDCTDEEVDMLLGVKLPKEINESNINTCGENFIQIEVGNELFVVDEDMFYSIYNVRTELDKALFGYEVKEEIKEEVKEDNNAIEIIENEINKLKETYDYYKDQAVEVNRKISLLQDLLNKINK